MPATPFKDIGKACSDLLTKDYTVGKNVLEVKSKTANGVTFTPKATKSGDKLDGTLTAKYMFPAKISGEAKIDTKGVLSTTFETAALAKGLTVTMDCEAPSAGSAVLSVAKATVDYKQSMFTSKFSYEYYKSAASAALSAAYGSLVMGCSADTTLAPKFALGKYAAACQFVQPDFTLAAKLSDSSKPGSTVYEGSYFHKVSPAMQVGAEVKKAKDVGVAFGCAYKLDKATSVKGKVATDGILTASYKQDISPISTLTLAATVDTVNLASSSNHKFGLSLSITP